MSCDQMEQVSSAPSASDDYLIRHRDGGVGLLLSRALISLPIIMKYLVTVNIDFRWLLIIFNPLNSIIQPHGITQPQTSTMSLLERHLEQIALSADSIASLP